MARSTKRDRISELPDEIIHHILSFLLMNDATKTCLLSKRWRYQWCFNPNLNFPFRTSYCMFQGNQEVAAINRCISLYKPAKLHSLHIDLNLFDINPLKQIESWITFAAKREVEYFNLDEYFIVPVSLFYSESIRFLRMKSCMFSPPLDFKGFPLLKTLYLNNVKVDDSSTIQSLLSTCPCLQNLELEDLINIKNLTIKSTMSLQHLVVSRLEGYDIFHAPNLLYFRCHDHNLKQLNLNNAPSLVTVDISSVSFAQGTCPAEAVRECRPLFSLDLSHVRCLRANHYFIQWLSVECYLKRSERNVFKNIEIFNLDGRINDNFTIYALVSFFQDCPSLENIKIDVRYPWSDYKHNSISAFMEKELAEGRVCHDITDYLLYNLKNIQLNGFLGREAVMLVKIILEKAVALEKFFLFSMLGCMTSEYELTSFAKRSSSAKIIFENGLRLNSLPSSFLQSAEIMGSKHVSN